MDICILTLSTSVAADLHCLFYRCTIFACLDRGEVVIYAKCSCHVCVMLSMHKCLLSIFFSFFCLWVWLWDGWCSNTLDKTDDLLFQSAIVLLYSPNWFKCLLYHVTLYTAYGNSSSPLIVSSHVLHFHSGICILSIINYCCLFCSTYIPANYIFPLRIIKY